MSSTLIDRVDEYVRCNPGATYIEVSQQMRLGREHARACLSRLQKRGRLVSTKSPDRVRAYYPAPETVVTDRLVKRARQYGAPFGILMAQVVMP